MQRYLLLFCVYLTLTTGIIADTYTKPISDTKGVQTIDLWDALRDHFALNHLEKDALVARYIKLYTKHPKRFEKNLAKAEPYLHFLLAATLKHKLPSELALLPFIESHFNPFAHSQAGASGLWQLMPSVASGYQLQINSWRDDRRDVVLATHTALKHLDYLHGRLHKNWTYAISAYNAGEGNVRKNLKQHYKFHKNPPLLNQLSKNHESKHYVPKFLALCAIVAHPEKYHITLPKIKNAPVFGPVYLNRTYAFSQLADICQFNQDTLRSFNASWRRQTTATDSPSYVFYLPVTHISTCTKLLSDALKEKNSSWVYHTVRPRDKVSNIAKLYNTSASNISTYNYLVNNRLSPGQKLLIHQGNRNLVSIHKNLATSQIISSKHLPGPRKIIHTAKKGQTLKTIARYYQTSEAKLRYWNQIREKDTIQPNDKIIMWQSFPRTYHVVRYGESLGTIAQKYRTTVDRLKKLNQLSTSLIKTGRKLRVR